MSATVLAAAEIQSSLHSALPLHPQDETLPPPLKRQKFDNVTSNPSERAEPSVTSKAAASSMHPPNTGAPLLLGTTPATQMAVQRPPTTATQTTLGVVLPPEVLNAMQMYTVNDVAMMPVSEQKNTIESEPHASRYVEDNPSLHLANPSCQQATPPSQLTFKRLFRSSVQQRASPLDDSNARIQTAFSTSRSLRATEAIAQNAKPQPILAEATKNKNPAVQAASISPAPRTPDVETQVEPLADGGASSTLETVSAGQGGGKVGVIAGVVEAVEGDRERESNEVEHRAESSAAAEHPESQVNVGGDDNAMGQQDLPRRSVPLMSSKTSADQTSVQRRPIASAASNGISLPMLRSSPVFADPDGRPAQPVMQPQEAGSATQPANKQSSTQDNDLLQQERQSPNASSGTVRKRRRKVSWAPEEKLVDIHLIDNRLELVRSWDPETQITLPFAPTTLQLIQSAIQEEEAVKKSGKPGSAGKGSPSTGLRALPQMSSFAEARKREHDMELERARKAREELQQRLRDMAPKREWRKPWAIVLPTECRIDESSVTFFDIVKDDYFSDAVVPSGDLSSPPSPPQPAHDHSRSSRRQIPNIPLSDNLGGNQDTPPHEEESSRGADRDHSGQSGRRDYYGSNNYSRNERSSDAGYRNRSNGRGYHTDQNVNEDRRGDYDRDRRSNYNDAQNAGMLPLTFKGGIPPGLPPPPLGVQQLLSAIHSSGAIKPENDMTHGRGNMVYPGQHRGNGDTGENSYREGHESHVQGGRGHDGGDAYGSDENRKSHNGDEIDGGSMMGPGQQLPPGFPPGVQQGGMMDMMPFPMPPIPPPPLGMPPNMMPLGLGIPMPMGMPMGMPMPMPPGHIGLGGPGMGSNMIAGGAGRKGAMSSGRSIETITRPKPKPMKQRKRCKYFGTKQGCRDGSSCMFAHN